MCDVSKEKRKKIIEYRQIDLYEMTHIETCKGYFRPTKVDHLDCTKNELSELCAKELQFHRGKRK